jgi:hypothetical protein
MDHLQTIPDGESSAALITAREACEILNMTGCLRAVLSCLAMMPQKS